MDRTYNIYEPLVWLDRDAKPVPRLATKWESIDGNKKWRFYLRKGVVFHNGEKFAAQDVAFTIDFTKDPQNKIGRRGLVVGYSYKVIDDYTIDVFREDGKTVDPLLPLVWYMVQIVSKSTVSKTTLDKLSREPIGTGPFELVEWRGGEQITLKAFDNYWGGRPKIDKVLIKTIPEMAIRIVALRTGDVDIVSDLPPEEVRSLEADPNLKIVKKEALLNNHVTLRSDIPPLKDNINLRKAIAHAISVEDICKNILGGYAVPVASVVPYGAFGYNENLRPYEYNPQLAKEYLKKSGYKGEEIAIQSSSGRYSKDIEINTTINTWLKAIGIKTKLNIYDWPTWINLYNTRKMDPIFLTQWPSRSADGAETLFNACHSRSSGSWFGEGGVPGVDELIDRARTNFDPVVRKEAIEKAQLLLHDYVAYAMAYTPIKLYGIRKNVKWAPPKADETLSVYVEDDKL
jgi:peptide/nickel transport system substrate-binding protein